MKKFTDVCFVLFCFILFNSTIAAQEHEKEMSAEEKAWMEYMTPGWAHEMMAKSVGKWNTKSTFWQYPGAEPMMSEGTSEAEMILGGRYFRAFHKGNVMGMEMNGINLMGYDNMQKQFNAIWIDNMGTGIATANGKYNEETKSIEMKGTMVDPMAGGEVEYRQVLKMIDDDNHLFEMYMMADGNEFKSFVMTYTRQK